MNTKPEESATDLNSAVGHRNPRPLKEMLLRARDFRFVAGLALQGLGGLWHSISPSQFSSAYRRVRAYTMCSIARLRGLYRGVQYVVQHDIRGDFVECGCARGGSAALLRLALHQMEAHRPLWVFDTFEGLPAPASDDPDFEIAELYKGTCKGSIEEVRDLFARLQVTADVHFVKGLFQDTLPSAEVKQIALLHIDGDWYESVKVCLETLYDKVVPGGFIQFDDYGYWEGARKAVDEFFKLRGIEAPLTRLDYAGRVLIKPAS